MIDLHKLDAYRVIDPRIGWAGDSNHGAFEIRSEAHGGTLRCVVSSGYGWDHVSVSIAGVRHCPSWADMKQMHRTFFLPEEAAFQYHAPESEYIDGENGSGHPYCLHLWRPYAATVGEIPVPPKWMVGGVTREEADAACDAYIAKHGVGIK